MDRCVFVCLCECVPCMGANVKLMRNSYHERSVKWDFVEVDLSLWSDVNAYCIYYTNKLYAVGHVCICVSMHAYVMLIHFHCIVDFWQASSCSFARVSERSLISKTHFQTTLLTAGYLPNGNRVYAATIIDVSATANLLFAAGFSQHTSNAATTPPPHSPPFHPSILKRHLIHATCSSILNTAEQYLRHHCAEIRANILINI